MWLSWLFNGKIIYIDILKKEKIMAKKFDYFVCFSDITKIACKQAELLKETTDNYSIDNIHENIKVMHELERNGDDLRHELYDHLLHEFLPPFEHEDITSLIEKLDDVCDAIDDVLMKFYMYNITSCRDDVKFITQGIIDCTLKLAEITDMLPTYKKDTKKLFDIINEVGIIEEQGDYYYMEYSHNLFAENDINEIIKWKSLYATLEACYDTCEEATEVVRNIIIKNS